MSEARLKALGLRLTPQRRVVLEVLREGSGHLTPQEVCRRAQAHLPGLNEATVYRILALFERRGVVLSADWPGVGRVYELAPTHHHLVCRHCGATLEVADTLLQPLYTALEQATGYRIVHQHLALHGVCPACKADQTEEDRLC